MHLQIPDDIELSAEHIVHSIGRESVDVCRFIGRRFADNDPESDLLLEFVFRSFYP